MLGLSRPALTHEASVFTWQELEPFRRCNPEFLASAGHSYTDRAGLTLFKTSFASTYCTCSLVANS